MAYPCCDVTKTLLMGLGDNIARSKTDIKIL